jgi:hypothetical protein
VVSWDPPSSEAAVHSVPLRRDPLASVGVDAQAPQDVSVRVSENAQRLPARLSVPGSPGRAEHTDEYHMGFVLLTTAPLIATSPARGPAANRY